MRGHVEALARELRELVTGEGCDHSAGICWCATFRTLEAAEAALTRSTAKRLRREARAAARFRGHNLAPFRPLETGRTWNATCTACGREAVVDVKPPPNGIDVGGAAVALDCDYTAPPVTQYVSDPASLEGEGWYAWPSDGRGVDLRVGPYPTKTEALRALGSDYKGSA